MKYDFLNKLVYLIILFLMVYHFSFVIKLVIFFLLLQTSGNFFKIIRLFLSST